MRIGMVTTTFLPIVGGIEWKVHYLSTEYIKRGHEVVVFTTRPYRYPRPIPMPIKPIYPVVRIGLQWRGIERLGITKFLFLRAILRHHRQRPFDVLQCHHVGSPLYLGLAVKRRIGIPVVGTTCGGDVQRVPEIGYGTRLRPRFDRMTRANVREADVIGSISSAVREDLVKMGTTAHIVDIPNGVPWDEFQTGPSTLLRDRLGLNREHMLILSVGRNHIKKAYALGIEAFAKIAAQFPQAHYALVGRGTSQLKDVVARLGLAVRVHLVEQVPMSDMPHIYHSADVFFNPSLVEGFAQVNAQALACALPCVITDAPGNRDAGDYGGALIARSGDVASLSSELGRLVGDVELRRRLSTEAHAASRRYAWSCIAEQYLSVFQQLIDSRMASARNNS